MFFYSHCQSHLLILLPLHWWICLLLAVQRKWSSSMVHNQWKELGAFRDQFVSTRHLRMEWLSFLLSTKGTWRLNWQFSYIAICWSKIVLLQMHHAFKTIWKNKLLTTYHNISLTYFHQEIGRCSDTIQQIIQPHSTTINVPFSFMKCLNHSTSYISEELPHVKEFTNSNPGHSGTFQDCSSSTYILRQT